MDITEHHERTERNMLNKILTGALALCGAAGVAANAFVAVSLFI